MKPLEVTAWTSFQQRGGATEMIQKSSLPEQDTRLYLTMSCTLQEPCTILSTYHTDQSPLRDC